MTTDRELLVLAAKAAGIKLKVLGDNQWRIDAYGQSIGYWNPLTDDGDAFRLAVMLDIQTQAMSGLIMATYPFNDGFHERKTLCESMVVAVGPVSLDVFAATRRAIVRAAAEIGRAMP